MGKFQVTPCAFHKNTTKVLRLEQEPRYKKMSYALQVSKNNLIQNNVKDHAQRLLEDIIEHPLNIVKVALITSSMHKVTQTNILDI
jgi:hypothetical protein